MNNSFIDTDTLKRIKESPMTARRSYRRRQKLPIESKDPGEMTWGEVASSMYRNFPKDSKRVFKENIDALKDPATTVTTLHDLSVETAGKAVDKFAIQPITKLTGVKSWASAEGESPLFDAIWNYYRDAYGMGPEGVKDFKRYIVKHPAEFLADVSSIFMAGAKYTGLSAKTLSNNRSGILRRLKDSRFLKYAPPKTRIVNGRPGDLDRFGSAAYYIGTGIEDGGYEPGFWARVAHETLKYMDSTNVAMMFGGRTIGTGLGLLSRTTDYPQKINDIAERLYKKYHDDFVGMNPKDIDFNLEEFIESTLITKSEQINPGKLGGSYDPNWLYQMQSNKRLQELEKSLINRVGSDNIDRAGLNAISIFREFGEATYSDLRNRYTHLPIDEVPVSTGIPRTMKVFDDIQSQIADKRIQSSAYGMTYDLEFEKRQPQNLSEELMKLLYSQRNNNANFTMHVAGVKELDAEFAEKIRNISNQSTLSKDELSQVALAQSDVTQAAIVQAIQWRNERQGWNYHVIDHIQTEMSIGDINHLREQILQLMLKYNTDMQSRHLVALYDALTQDYYDNLTTAMKGARNNPIYRTQMTESLPEIKEFIIGALDSQYESRKMYGQAESDRIISKWLQLGKDNNKLADYILEGGIDFDRDHAILSNLRWNSVQIGKHLSQMDEKSYQQHVSAMWDEADRLIDEIRDEANIALLNHNDAAQRTDRRFKKVLFGAIDDLDDPATMRMVSNLLFDTDMVDTAMLENIFDQLDEPRAKMLRSVLTEQLFNRSRSKEGLWFRIATVDEDVFTWASDDPELARELDQVISNAKGMWSDYKPGGLSRADITQRFRKLKSENYNVKDISTEEVDKIIEHAKNKEYDKILDYMQPEGTAFYAGKNRGGGGIESKRPEVRRTGVFTAKSEEMIKKYWDVGWTELDDPNRAVLILMYGEDTGGRGVPQPMNEYIIIPTEIVSAGDPIKFSEDLAKGKRAWRPAVELKMQLDLLGEARAKAIWGDEVVDDLYQFAELAESFPGYRKPNSKGKYKSKYVQNFLGQALTPGNQVYDGIARLESAQDVFDTGDGLTTTLNMIFRLLGDESVADFLRKAGAEDYILNHYSKKDVATVRNWIRQFRRIYDITVQKSNKAKQENRKPATIPYNPNIPAMKQLRSPLR